MIEIIPNWHPLFVHFTVALLLVAFVFYGLSFLGSGERWLLVARVNLFVGVLLTVATVLAGFDAYNSVRHDGPSHAAMSDHRNWALVTAALWLLIALWEAWRAKRGQGRSWAVAAALLIAVALLLVTGYKGSELVYRYGLGVQSLPDASAATNHEH